MVEQLTFNQLVVGSIPTPLTNFFLFSTLYELSTLLTVRLSEGVRVGRESDSLTENGLPIWEAVCVWSALRSLPC